MQLQILFLTRILFSMCECSKVFIGGGGLTGKEVEATGQVWEVKARELCKGFSLVGLPIEVSDPFVTTMQMSTD